MLLFLETYCKTELSKSRQKNPAPFRTAELKNELLHAQERSADAGWLGWPGLVGTFGFDDDDYYNSTTTSTTHHHDQGV